jgi:plastocyanin
MISTANTLRRRLSRMGLLVVGLLLLAAALLVPGCGSSTTTTAAGGPTTTSSTSGGAYGATPTTTTTAATPTTAGSGGAQVTLQNFAFSPASVTVKVGDTVTWTNKDSANHTVTADDGTTFASSTLSSGATFSFTFTKAGTYAYHCSIHTSMTGTITVK